MTGWDINVEGDCSFLTFTAKGFYLKSCSMYWGISIVASAAKQSISLLRRYEPSSEKARLSEARVVAV